MGVPSLVAVSYYPRLDERALQEPVLLYSLEVVAYGGDPYACKAAVVLPFLVVTDQPVAVQIMEPGL